VLLHLINTLAKFYRSKLIRRRLKSSINSRHCLFHQQIPGWRIYITSLQLFLRITIADTERLPAGSHQVSGHMWVNLVVKSSQAFLDGHNCMTAIFRCLCKFLSTREVLRMKPVNCDEDGERSKVEGIMLRTRRYMWG
jgi:hypothetical protein